ncbi:outer membrane lipoprotein-sorting protein [Methanosarcina barkeri]|uniref:outer membrane lipoprotein-sorting protein n=1 Tax=Methanosarcina barkeri TaxID=2208 RepID=UPI00311E2106
MGIILNDTNVSLLGVEKLDNRETYLLNTNPKETGKSAAQYYTKVWVDKETWMPLKYEMYDSSGNLTAKVEIWDLKVNSGIPDSEFVFNIPDGAEIKQQVNTFTRLPQSFFILFPI